MKALIYGALILASFNIAEAKTASDLTTEVRVLIRDPSETGRTRFSNTQILTFLNEAQKDAIGYTLCIRKEYSFDSVSGTVYYSLPEDYISIDRVLSDGTRLEPKTLLKLDQEDTTWESDSGTATAYFTNYSSRTKIGIYPYPASATSTSTIKVEYYAQIYDMSTSSEPFNGISDFTPFHQMLSYYAAAQLLYIDGVNTTADRYFNRYMDYRNILHEYCRDRNPSIKRGSK